MFHFTFETEKGTNMDKTKLGKEVQTHVPILVVELNAPIAIVCSC